jgi:predicted peptidase
MQTDHLYQERPYLLYTPAAAAIHPATRLPLILFLHGSGERGDDPAAIKQWGLPRELETRPAFPGWVLSPLCPANLRWTDLDAEVMALLDAVLDATQADPRRVYLTGFSMGGQGAWHLAVAHPDRFAAVAPVAGRIPPASDFLARLCVLRQTPVWVFHGEQDEFVPTENSEIIARTLQACGGQVRLTVYAGLGHGPTSDEVYRGDTLTNWFWQHSLR